MYMYIYTLTRGSTDFAMSRYRNKTPQFLNKTTHQVSTDFVCCNIETRYLTLEDNSYTLDVPQILQCRGTETKPPNFK